MTTDPTASTPTASSSAAKPPQSESVKDTLISIVIAFALAFVFRGFVVEAFVIPTGSMAPTLMGAHMRFRSPTSGYSWAVGPWEGLAGQVNEYAPVQGAGSHSSISVHDPVSGEVVEKRNVPLRSGDRILVLKYLFWVMEPSRFDVIVFKNPTNPGENYIKRLIGLAREEVALVDGDVFTRPLDPSQPAKPADGPGKTWELDGWHIARKDPLEQRAVWQMIFDSSYASLATAGNAAASSLSPPWNSPDARSWSFDGPAYRFDGAAANQGGAVRSDRTELFFDKSRQRFAPLLFRNIQRGENWSIDDRYAYDEIPMPGGGSELREESFQLSPRFPVADLRMRAGIKPDQPGLKVEATIRARGHDFQAHVEDGAGSTGRITLRMRPLVGPTGVVGAWTDLKTAEFPGLPAGKVTDVEFWHSDQSLQLWIDGKRVAVAEYDWSPAARLENSTGRTLAQIMSDRSANRINPLANPDLYRARAPDVRWTFSGPQAAGGVSSQPLALTLYRVGLDRDLYYQPSVKGRAQPRSSIPALGTSPEAPLLLGEDQFFACGDNSPQSLDGRLWDEIDPWVAHELDNTIGVVPRELLLGKAFFVYWPSLIKGGRGIPVPDFGRMRFIW